MMNRIVGFILTLVLWFLMAIVPPIIILSSCSMLLVKSWFALFMFFPLLFIIALYITIMRLFNVVIRGFRFFDEWQLKYYVTSGILGSFVGVYYYLRKVVYSADIQSLWKKIVVQNFEADPLRCSIILFLYTLIAVFLFVALAFRGTDMNKLIPKVNLRAPIDKLLSYYS